MSLALKVRSQEQWDSWQAKILSQWPLLFTPQVIGLPMQTQFYHTTKAQIDVLQTLCGYHRYLIDCEQTTVEYVLNHIQNNPNQDQVGIFVYQPD